MKVYFGLIIFLLFIVIVLVRSAILKKQGIEAIEFGKKDKKDFFIPPFAFFYLYLITANAFSLPTIPGQKLFDIELVSCAGILFCLAGLSFFIWTMISFKKSFRVGLVDNTPQGLITAGAFSVSRNPIYVSFAVLLTGQFLIFPSWILLIYVFAGMATFHRQVLKEEKFLSDQYDKEFELYCKKVRRYL
ncbi:MAG: isoprenylcysteine carboxylmethyltransferase family protein [Bacteroidota bacterium]